MCVNELMRLAGQIQTLGLPEEQEEVLMVQAADLVRFKESFGGDLEFVDPFSHRVSLVADEAGMAGICFCGHEDTPAMQQILTATERFKHLKRVQETWFVFVGGPGEAFRQSVSSLMAQHKIKQLYTRVFLLNYFTATLQPL
ncbi:MAG: hypothetical protein EOP54_26705 [Sphingobacteriales bacterium]|nr:MAG: hypothetical protein EOP54_26705 [Sphingobacteriales bacterium]